MNWNVLIAASARKKLKRIPKNDAARIRVVIDATADNPFGGDIEKLKDEDDRWRRRVGNYRILLFRILIYQRVGFIYEVMRRTSNTY